jgi:hypothetical protein
MKKLFAYLTLSLIVLSALSVGVHEIGHWLAGILFYHTNGSISFLQGIYAGLYTPNTNTGILVPYAGGIFTALVFGLVFLFTRKILPIGIKISLVAICLGQLFYGFREGYAKQTNINIDALIILVLIAAFTVFIIYSLTVLKEIKEIKYEKSSV